HDLRQLLETGFPVGYFLPAQIRLVTNAGVNIRHILRRRVAHMGVSDLRTEPLPIFFSSAGIAKEKSISQIVFEPRRGLFASLLREAFSSLGACLAPARLFCLLESKFFLVGSPNLGEKLFCLWV
ncbi:MAG: hypothetical protein M3430_19305, partial [Acidobacteriota bacterium]|nr:hypothetical protein [Acidobacteriota bacterium]